MDRPSSAYRCYVLRIWRESDCIGDDWRASLEDFPSGERKGFANHNSLSKFLWEPVNEVPSTDENPANIPTMPQLRIVYWIQGGKYACVLLPSTFFTDIDCLSTNRDAIRGSTNDQE